MLCWDHLRHAPWPWGVSPSILYVSIWVLKYFRMSPEWLLQELTTSSDRVLHELRLSLNEVRLNCEWFLLQLWTGLVEICMSSELLGSYECSSSDFWMSSDGVTAACGTDCLQNQLPEEPGASRTGCLKSSISTYFPMAISVLCWQHVLHTSSPWDISPSRLYPQSIDGPERLVVCSNTWARQCISYNVT